MNAIFQPFRLVSLMDILRDYAARYIDLGRQIADAEMIFVIAKNETVKTIPGFGGINAAALPSPVETREITEYEELSSEDKETLTQYLTEMVEICEKLGLRTSVVLLKKRLKDLPKTGREFALLVDAMLSELRSTLFLFVPNHRTQFFADRLSLSDEIRAKFPLAAKEIIAAGNCLAMGSYTAAVFHSMRASELGLRTLAKKLKISFPGSIDLESWKNIIDPIESKIRDMEKLKKSKRKSADLKFYAEAAKQFRYFREAWRNHVMHTRETYLEGQALDVFNHVHAFFVTLSARLQEPKRAP